MRSQGPKESFAWLAAHEPAAHAAFEQALRPGASPEARARCSATRGPAAPYRTLGELRRLLVGAWYRCSSTGGDVDPTGSLQFSADGTWQRLVPGTSDALEPAPGGT